MAKRDLFLIIIVIFGVIFITGCTSNSSNDDSSASSKLDISKMDLTGNEDRAKKISEAMDIANPETRDGALSLIKHSSTGDYNPNQIIDIWNSVVTHWTYVNDPNGLDYLSPASRTTKLGYKGDCDDFAILIASYIKAIGGESRVILVHNEDEGGHYYAEVYVTSKDQLDNYINSIKKRYNNARSFYYHAEQKNGKTDYWLNLDWSGSRPGSKFYYNDDDSYYAYYSDGTYKKVYKSNEKCYWELPTTKSTPKPTLDLSKLDSPTPKPTLDLSALKTPTPKPTFSMSDLLAM